MALNKNALGKEYPPQEYKITAEETKKYAYGYNEASLVFLDETRPGNDERAGDILYRGKERFKKSRAGIGLRSLAAAGSESDHALGAILTEPEEFGLPFLKGKDVDNPVNRCFHGPFDPFKVQRAPLPDNGDLKPGLDIDSMVRPGIHAMLDGPGQAEADAMLGKLHLFNPDAKTDRPFLHLLRPDLVRGCINAPERGGKYQVAFMDEVPKVPEVVDALREQPDLAIPFFQFPVLSLHDDLQYLNRRGVRMPLPVRYSGSL